MPPNVSFRHSQIAHGDGLGLNILQSKIALDVFHYWTRLRDERAVPARQDIEPSDLRDQLAHIFIIGSDNGRAGLQFRVCGTRISALFGRELRGKPYTTLFSAGGQALASRLARNCAESADIGVILASGKSKKGRNIECEIILLPLEDEAGELRILGALTPLTSDFWHGLEAVLPLDIQSVRVLDLARSLPFLTNRPELDVRSMIASPQIAPDAGEILNATTAKLRFTVIKGGKS
jgi:hypothetical protein